MSKRKVGPMRPKTKEAMVRLAEIMVAKHKLEMIKGTPEFLEYAIHEAEENDLGISWQTIKLREQFLEMRCDELYKVVKNTTVEDVEYDVFEDEEWYWAGGDMVDHDAIIKRGLELAMKKFEKDDSKRFDEIVGDFFDEEEDEILYNMFYVGEDGLTWRNGKFIHQPVGTPGLRYMNKAGIVTTERTHAKYMLNQTPNSYTEGDVDVLTKVATGTYNSL
jgi:hypothetical protein